MTKFPIKTILQVLVTTFSLLKCDAQHLHAKLNMQQVRDAIVENNDNYFKAFSKGDSSLIVDRYTDDCWIMPSNQPTHCDPEAALDFFRVAYYQLGVRKGKFLSIDVFGDGQDFVIKTPFFQTKILYL